MLHTDNIEIGGIPFIHNYSDSGFMIEREDGKRFSDAKDLATENHTYVETDEPKLEPETDIPIDIEPRNLPTFLHSNFLGGTPTDQIIDVANQEMLTALSSATNISDYANRMVIKEV